MSFGARDAATRSSGFRRVTWNTPAIFATKLESRPKREIERALEAATRECGKGPYQHGQAHEVMEFVRPERVQSLRHGQRLFAGLGELITGSGTE